MKEFHTKYKHHIRLWIILALITAISGYVAFRNSSETQPQEQASSTLKELQVLVKNEATKVEKQKIVYTSVDNFVSTTTEAEITAHAILRIEDLIYSILIEPGNTAYDLMAKAQTDGLIRFSARDYGGDMGQLIEEINGIRSSVRNKKYWIYYINGKKATVGISNYQLKPGDTISWQYEYETF